MVERAHVRLRLFARAREAAGTGSDKREAHTLGELLDAARADYPPEFAAVLETARVWVNGDEPADGERTRLHDGDEVAVLPPVSGGRGGPAPKLQAGTDSGSSPTQR